MKKSAIKLRTAFGSAARPTSVGLAALVALSGCLASNDPQYVSCGSADGSDSCLLDSANGSDIPNGNDTVFAVRGSLHVPIVNPDQTLEQATEALQKTLPDDVVVPVYRLDMYDISVEWAVTNLDDQDGQARVALNAANEDFAWDPTLIVPAGDESPPPPDLQGDQPFTVAAHSTVQGEFTEDDLLEAAIDLDQITRGNINMYQATLIVNKNDQSFQPLSPEQMPPADSDDPPAQTAMGDPVPRSAFRQITRADIIFKPDPDVHMQLSFDVRLRVQTENVIARDGMNAAAGQLNIIDPPDFVPAYTP